MDARPASPFGRPIAIAGPLGDLARAVGGVGVLTQLLGVSASSLRRWASEGLPLTGRLLVDRVAKERGLGRLVAPLHREAPTHDDQRGRRQSHAPPARPVRLRGVLGQLAAKVGGSRRLAELTGVHQRSVQKWAQGVRIPGVAMRLLLQLAIEHGLSQDARKKLAALADTRPAANSKSPRRRASRTRRSQ